MSLIDESELSQQAIHNINVLIKTVKRRIYRRYKLSRSYTTDQLTYFILNSITMFNSVPHFSFVNVNDTDTLEKYHNVFVDGAVLMALSVEENTGMSLSDMLKTEFREEWDEYFERVKEIKNGWKNEEGK
jgi:hypothetical protein